jgi:predicted dehydrogenase
MGKPAREAPLRHRKALLLGLICPYHEIRRRQIVAGRASVDGRRYTMSHSDSSSESIPRREFLKTSVAAAGVLSGTLGVTKRAAAQVNAARTSGVIGANDRIRIGVIGCGGLGLHFHIPTLLRLSKDPGQNVELAAVCDIYEPRKWQARENSGAELFHDYRQMLDRPDIHGVVIVTPDHWHHRMAIDAMEAGKDIHLEKPMTLYWEEAKEIYETSERLKRVVQVGAEGTSRDVYWQARRIIQEGKLGKLVWATGGVYRNNPEGDWNYPIEPNCTPQTLDWDAFLGPAPKRPFDPERYFRYRKYWDYSGGLAHDLLAHVLSAMQICIGAEFPTRVSAAGGIYVHHDRETPDTFHMMVEFPSQYTLTMFCTQATQNGVDFVIRGDKGSLHFPPPGKGEIRGVEFRPEPPYRSEAEPFSVGEEPRMDHDENFIACMRTREKPHYDALSGYKAMVALGLAVRSWREGKMFTFDPEKQQIVSPA